VTCKSDQGDDVFSPQTKKAAKVDIFMLIRLMLFIKNNIIPFFTRIRIQRKQPLQYKTFNTKAALKMPLVVPGINSGGDNSKTNEWTQKLVGKKIGESHDATVSPNSP
jgi:uncharacterized protein involved in response to NO